MDFYLNQMQQQVVDSVQNLVDAVSTESESEAVFDSALWQQLPDLDLSGKGGEENSVFRSRCDGDELLEAVLITEEVSKHNGLVPVGVQTLVSPLLTELIADSHLRQPLAIQFAGNTTPVRYLSDARLLIEVSGSEAAVYEAGNCDLQSVESNYGYPVAALKNTGEKPQAVLDAEPVVRRWQLAITAEIVGAMNCAVQHMVGYLSERHQFGRPIGSFQAVQHRLAELATSVECARILVREAAWKDYTELAATAACYAATAAREVCLDAHQLSGARGFTLAFGLHRATLRLQLLSLEAGGNNRHANVAAEKRWG